VRCAVSCQRKNAPTVPGRRTQTLSGHSIDAAMSAQSGASDWVCSVDSGPGLGAKEHPVTPETKNPWMQVAKPCTVKRPRLVPLPTSFVVKNGSKAHAAISGGSLHRYSRPPRRRSRPPPRRRRWHGPEPIARSSAQRRSALLSLHEQAVTRGRRARRRA